MEILGTLGGEWALVRQLTDDEIADLCDALGTASVAHIVRRLCGRLDLALPPKDAVMRACREVLDDPNRDFSTKQWAHGSRTGSPQSGFMQAVERCLREMLRTGERHAALLRGHTRGLVNRDYLEPGSGNLKLRKG